jgi:hypothetical protein
MARPAIGPFLLVVGGLLVAWGIIGWFLPMEDGAGATNIFYIVIGVLLAWSGWMWAPGVRHDWTTNVGFIFIVLAVIGFAVSGRAAPNLGFANLEHPADNVINLVTGIVLILGGRRVLTEDVFLPPRAYRGVG